MACFPVFAFPYLYAHGEMEAFSSGLMFLVGAKALVSSCRGTVSTAAPSEDFCVFAECFGTTAASLVITIIIIIIATQAA